MKDLSEKKVLVVGIGASGQAAGNLLLAKGASLWITEKEDSERTRKIADCFIRKGAFVELGRHTEDFVKEKDLVVISPGVSSKSETVIWAKKYNIPVISELELAGWYIDCPMICVTGTNGKSTVTSLIDHILRTAGKKSVACGNLGMPLSEVVLNYNELDFAVVEASSFQLEYIKDFRPYISVWLNFSYDHLDHHSSMDEYLNAKKRIFENQTKDDWAVVYYGESERVGVIKAKKMIYGENGDLGFVFENEFLNGRPATKALAGRPATGALAGRPATGALAGRHNQDNIIAASIAAKICGVPNNLIEGAVGEFKQLPHRMEYVANINGIDFIDDSKATNVHAVIPALESFSKPIVLILGGRDKGDDFTRLRDVIKDKVSFVVVIGEAKEKIMSQLKGSTSLCESPSLDDAVNCAYNNSASGTTVLLSPGCSSFDMFTDYNERGERFQEAVGKLKGPQRATRGLPEVAGGLSIQGEIYEK